MVGMYDDEALPTKVRAEVIDQIRMVNENPFLFESDVTSLTVAFEEFARNVQSAKTNLHKLTGVSAEGAATKVEDVVRDTITILNKAEETGKPVELILSSAFMQCAKKPYFALLDLDKMAKTNKPLDAELAKEAMNGLEALQLFANVVPSVYKTISQDHGPRLESVA
jgi:hypothetical protein